MQQDSTAPAPDAPDAPDSGRKVGGDALMVGLGYLASFAYPLVSLPFLTRTIGVEPLGHLMFALALLQIVVYVTDFGFGMSALRRIAVAGSRAERSQVVAATLLAKLVLWIGATAVLMGIVLLVPTLRPYTSMYATGLALIGIGAMYPTWLLQGTGRVKAFALLTACSRLVALAFLLLTVRGPEDMELAMLWQQLPLALSAALAWLMIWRVWRAVEPVRIDRADLTDALYDSFPLFVSNASGIILGSSNSVVLGVVANPVQVAYFGAAERFSNAVRGVMRGVVDVMLPRMTREGEAAARLQRLISLGLLGSYGLTGLALVVLAPWFIPWYLGEALRPAVPVMQLLGVGLAVAGITVTLQLRATAQRRYGRIARLAIIGAVVHLALLLPAGYLHGAVGAAVAVIASESLMALLYVLDAASWRRRSAAAGGSPEDTAPDPEAGPAAPAPVPAPTPSRTTETPEASA